MGLEELASKEERLARFVVDTITEAACSRRIARASGDFRVKMIHRHGELVEVHVDDHVILTQASFDRADGKR